MITEGQYRQMKLRAFEEHRGKVARLSNISLPGEEDKERALREHEVEMETKWWDRASRETKHFTQSEWLSEWRRIYSKGYRAGRKKGRQDKIVERQIRGKMETRERPQATVIDDPEERDKIYTYLLLPDDISMEEIAEEVKLYGTGQIILVERRKKRRKKRRKPRSSVVPS